MHQTPNWVPLMVDFSPLSVIKPLTWAHLMVDFVDLSNFNLGLLQIWIQTLSF